MLHVSVFHTREHSPRGAARINRGYIKANPIEFCIATYERETARVILNFTGTFPLLARSARRGEVTIPAEFIPPSRLPIPESTKAPPLAREWWKTAAAWRNSRGMRALAVRFALWRASIATDLVRDECLAPHRASSSSWWSRAKCEKCARKELEPWLENRLVARSLWF
jgi:hypothetical protein